MLLLKKFAVIFLFILSSQVYADKKYTGELISLVFQDIEVSAVLQLIADFKKINMVISDKVTGNITLKLKNIPSDEALEIVLDSKNLGMKKTDHVIQVMTLDELVIYDSKQPLITKTIQLNYVPALEFIKLLEGYSNTKKVDEENEEEAYISSRASVIADARTNQIIVQDTKQNITKLKNLIKKIDTPIRQVLIDTKVVYATNLFTQDLGLKWGIRTSKDDDRESNKLDSVVNLGLSSKNMVSIVLDVFRDGMLDLEISASELEGTANLVSSPRVMASNGKNAVIKQGQQLPYLEQNESGNTIAFKDAVLSLDVTPLIIPNDKVFMDIRITKDSPDFSRSVAGFSPPLDTKEIQTSVLVDSGNTIALGGIYESENSFAVDSVPVLGDLPIIGSAFRAKSERNGKTELIFFITPSIVN